MTIDDTRRDNLRRLVEQYKGVGKLATAMGKDASQLSQWLNASADSKTGKPRGMRSDTCRQLEDKLGLSPGWLDTVHPEAVVSPHSTDDSNAELIGMAPTVSMIPVAGIAQLGENGWYEEVQISGTAGFVEHHSLDNEAYVLRVRGDSMHPAIRDGWFVSVEPNMRPAAGEYVAIQLVDGRKMVKEFLFQNATTITVESVNGGRRMSIPLDDVRSVHAVGAVIPPSKHKHY